MGAWQDTSTLFVELEAATYLAQADPNAYSCKDKKLAIDHYTNFLWCKNCQGARPGRCNREPRAAARREASGCRIRGEGLDAHAGAVTHQQPFGAHKARDISQVHAFLD